MAHKVYRSFLTIFFIITVAIGLRLSVFCFKINHLEQKTAFKIKRWKTNFFRKYKCYKSLYKRKPDFNTLNVSFFNDLPKCFRRCFVFLKKTKFKFTDPQKCWCDNDRFFSIYVLINHPPAHPFQKKKKFLSTYRPNFLSCDTY